jgi:hypothetical protein
MKKKTEKKRADEKKGYRRTQHTPRLNADTHTTHNSQYWFPARRLDIGTGGHRDSARDDRVT